MAPRPGSRDRGLQAAWDSRRIVLPSEPGEAHSGTEVMHWLLAVCVGLAASCPGGHRALRPQSPALVVEPCRGLGRGPTACGTFWD